METATAPKGAKPSEKEILRHEFLTIAEVALLLRVTQRTVYNLIYSGSLRATKITSRITVIPKEDFMNMIRINEYNRSNGLSKQQGKEIHFPSVADPVGSEPESEDKEKEKKTRKPSKPRPRKTPLKPSSDFKQSVKDTFKSASEVSEQPNDTLTELPNNSITELSIDRIIKIHNYIISKPSNYLIWKRPHNKFPRSTASLSLSPGWLRRLTQ